MLRFLVVLPFVLTLFAAPSSVAAQDSPSDPKGEFAVGYSLLYHSEPSLDVTLPLGWVVSGGVRATRNLSIVGEAGGHYKSRVDVLDIGLLADLKIHAFLGGVRVSATGGVRPFAEVLLGYVRYDVSMLGESGSLGGFMVAPGGGVDVPFASSAAFRVQANYRYADVNGPNHEFRLAVSLVKMW